MLSYHFLKKLSYEVVYPITLFHNLFNVVAFMLSVYIINYINTTYKLFLLLSDYQMNDVLTVLAY